MRLLSVLAGIILCVDHAATAENGTGCISGTVRVVGRVPVIPARSEEPDSEICGSDRQVVPALVMGTNQTVAGAIVYLGAMTGRIPATNLAPAVLDQVQCEFVPRVQWVASGSPLLVRNSDPTLHVVRFELLSATNPPATLLMLVTPYAGFEKRVVLDKFKEPALLKVMSANGYNWMTAYIAVIPHWWAAVTDEAGRFTITGLPSGSYKVYAWHEVLGTQAREVRVAGNRPATAEFAFTTASPPRSD
jgi:hypothetical protein